MSALKTKRRKQAADLCHGINSPVIKYVAFQKSTMEFLVRYSNLSVTTLLTAKASDVDTILIQKAGVQPTEAKQARPISINPALAKLPKTILARRMQQALSNSISSAQHGFIRGRSAHDAYQKLQSLWKSDPQAVTAFVDLSRAYDRISHDAILAGLRRFCMPDHFCNLIGRYLSSAKTRFHADDKVSEDVYLKRGLLQGCPLSPVLFTLATDFIFRGDSDTSDIGFADDLTATGNHILVHRTVNTWINELASIGLTVNAAKSSLSGTRTVKRLLIGQHTVFDRGEPIDYLGFPVARTPKEQRRLLLTRILTIVRSAVPQLYKLSYAQAVRYININLAPRISYVAKFAEFTQTELRMIDSPVMRVLMRHPGKYHVSTVHKGALYSLLRVQFPSVVVMRSRMYHCNLHPSVTSKYAKVMNISLPKPRHQLKAAMNVFFYEHYTAQWLKAKSGELVRSCPPLIREVHRLPPRRQTFALAFLTNTLATAHTMTRVRMRSNPMCACGHGACTSRHILGWHARMSITRIHWKQLMCVAHSHLLRMPR